MLRSVDKTPVRCTSQNGGTRHIKLYRSDAEVSMHS